MSNQMLTLSLRFNLGHAATLDMLLLTRKSLFAAEMIVIVSPRTHGYHRSKPGFRLVWWLPNLYRRTLSGSRYPEFFILRLRVLLKHTQRVELDQIAAR